MNGTQRQETGVQRALVGCGLLCRYGVDDEEDLGYRTSVGQPRLCFLLSGAWDAEVQTYLNFNLAILGPLEDEDGELNADYVPDVVFVSLKHYAQDPVRNSDLRAPAITGLGQWVIGVI